MKEIEVKSQAELDAIPIDFDGRIIIKFGTPYNRAVAYRRFRYSVELHDSASAVLYDSASAELHDSASAVLYGSASAELYGSASAELHGSASAVLYDSASAELYGSASAELHDSASAVLYGSASAVLHDSASAVLYGSASAVLYGSASAEFYGSASAVLYGSASAVLYGSASAELHGSASAEFYGSASAELYGNAQILDRSDAHKITTSGNSRIVYDPRTIEEYADSNGIELTETSAILYKAVHKFEGGRYVSDKNENFEYRIGDIIKADGLDLSPKVDCGHGIHMAHRAWCVDYGRNWNDLAILEVEAERDKIVVPLYGVGKVRAEQVKVLREVPLEECGIAGQIYLRRHKREEMNK